MRTRETGAAVRVQGETLDNLAEGVAVFGPDGRIRLSNPAFDALWRLPGRDYHAMLAGYHGPLLILNGERDHENRKAEPRALAAWPQARVEVVMDAGHACAVRRPDEFTDAVRRFLDGLTEARPVGT